MNEPWTFALLSIIAAAVTIASAALGLYFIRRAYRRGYNAGRRDRTYENADILAAIVHGNNDNKYMRARLDHCDQLLMSLELRP